MARRPKDPTPPDGSDLKARFAAALSDAIGNERGDQSRFSERTGISQGLVSDYCSGTRYPTPEMMERLARGLGYLSAAAMLARLLAPPGIERALAVLEWLEDLEPAARAGLEAFAGRKLPEVSARPERAPDSAARDEGDGRKSQG